MRAVVKGDPRRAHVELSVRLIQVTTGAVVGSATVTGVSPAASGQVFDGTLLQQAFADAAPRAVLLLSHTYDSLPEASIRSARGEEEVTLVRPGYGNLP